MGWNNCGLNTSQYKIPDIEDDYSALLWFDSVNYEYENNNDDRWQYLYFARLHYQKEKSEFKNTLYPISNEINPSKPNFENMNIINENFSNAKLIAPHSWSAAEMFLYLLDLDRGNI